MLSKVCSRSHGHPPGARSRAMISTKRAKSVGADVCRLRSSAAEPSVSMRNFQVNIRTSYNHPRYAHLARDFGRDHPPQHAIGFDAEALDIDANQSPLAEIDHRTHG